MDIKEILKKPIFRSWKFWVGVIIVFVVLPRLGGGGGSSKEGFFSDSTNFTTWTRDPGYAKSYVKSLTLRKDSTFTIEYEVDDYGTVDLSGTFSYDGEYNFYKDHIILFKDIQENAGLVSEKGTYSRLLLKWNDDVSSFHVTGNAFLGIPYKLSKPGYCGSRNFEGFHDFLLIEQSEDRKKVLNVGVIHYSCQERTGKRFNYCTWMKRK